MTTTQRQAELENCNFCKAILMLLIVAYHVILPWTGNWAWIGMKIPSEGLRYCAYWLNTFHIYAFTLISGYVYAFCRLEKDKYQTYGKLIRNKTRRLLVPYVFLMLLWVGPIEAAVQGYGWTGFVRTHLLGVNPQQLWFLLMLFGVFLTFYPLTSFFRDNDIKGAAVAVALYCIGTVCNRYIDDYFQIWQICRFVLFFWLGFKIRQSWSGMLNRIPALLYIVVDLLLFAVTYLMPADTLILNAIRSGLFMLTCVVGAIMAFTVLQRIANKYTWKNSKIIVIFAKYSMPVYLIHQQVTYLLTIKLNGVISPYLQVPINFAFTICVSLAISAFLHRFKLTRKMLGEKA